MGFLLLSSKLRNWTLSRVRVESVSDARKQMSFSPSLKTDWQYFPMCLFVKTRSWLRRLWKESSVDSLSSYLWKNGLVKILLIGSNVYFMGKGDLATDAAQAVASPLAGGGAPLGVNHEHLWHDQKNPDLKSSIPFHFIGQNINVVSYHRCSWIIPY